MSEIQFFYSPGSSSLGSHILLQECGLDFEGIIISVRNNRYPESMKHLNPKMRVPILIMDGETITEAPAIMLAVALRAKRPELFGSSDLEKVRVTEWMNWLSGTLHACGIGAWNRPHRFTDDESVYPQIQAKAQKTVLDCFTQVDLKMNGSYAVGSSLTVVDVFLFVFWRYGNAKGLPMEQDYPNFAKAMTELRRRPSVEKTLKLEGLE